MIFRRRDIPIRLTAAARRWFGFRAFCMGMTQLAAAREWGLPEGFVREEFLKQL